MLVPDIAPAFERGDIDGAFIWEPELSALLKNGGKKLISAKDMADAGYATLDLEWVRTEFAKENPEYIRLYHQITVSGSPGGKAQSAELIESSTAKIYGEFIRRAAESGEIRSDIDPAAFAFLIDNLLMMLHYSYACDYYTDRFRIYFGEDAAARDEMVRDQMLKFIGSALKAEAR